jgi:hypothetical protein
MNDAILHHLIEETRPVRITIDGQPVGYTIVDVPIYARERWWETIWRHWRGLPRRIDHFEKGIRLDTPPPADKHVVVQYLKEMP